MAKLPICLVLVFCLINGNSAFPQQNAADSLRYEECDSSSLVMKPPCCGTTDKSNSRIVGGKEVEINEYPWMVYVLPIQCGGSLINNRFVLSAAHCFESSKPTKVLLGTIRGDGKGPNAMTIPVSKFISHEQYMNEGIIIFNDITLIKLQYKVEFSASIKPICLPYKTAGPFDFVHKDAVVTGWGVDESRRLSPILKETTISVWNFSKCKAVNSKLNKDNHICAGGIKGVDSCVGDSGGPLFMQLPKTKKSVSYWIQFGIVSFGFFDPKCGFDGSPGVYENVTTHMKWIEKTMRRMQ